MPEYKIEEVTKRRQLRKFVEFPDELYKDCPQYVPAIHSDQVSSLTDGVPSARYCPHKLWLAYKDGKVAGRICAMINPRYNDLYGKKRVRFGWFDVIDDIEVARLLLGTAEKWGKEQGMEEIHGPLWYNTLGKQGMLVEGFENIPQFNTLYNYPYYNDFVTSFGFEKECDWVQYKMPGRQEIPEKVRRISQLLFERYKLHEGNIDDLKKDKAKVKEFFDVYNESFASAVYNFIPFTPEEIEYEAKSVMGFLSNKTSVVIMDENDQLAAFAICFPSISKALQKAKGHLFPFGWWHLLRAQKNYENIDLMLNGATPKWQNTGVSGIYHMGMSDRCNANGSIWTVTNPQIETNSAANAWGKYDHELFMRRRCYLKKIDK